VSLSVVIPVRDDAAALRALLVQLAETGIAGKVVVVDDGSRRPLRARALRPQGVPRDWLHLIRLPASRGAGAARNIGQDAVTTRHLMFLDSDDRLLPGLAPLWADLQGRHFDFCLFRHADSRLGDLGGWGQPAFDDEHWLAAGTGQAAPQPVTRAAALSLVQCAAYPWTKIYRADFLREHAIQSSETPVHNDIALHWQSFLAADTLLASSREGVFHRVGRPGRLTRISGEERLCVFSVLDALSARIPHDSVWFPAWIAFTARLFDWIATTLDGPVLDRFTAGRQTFLAALPEPGFARLARIRPALAAQLLRQMAA
jgi:hypothetical protein